ncbi:MAG: N-acetylmuramoyl-L-alanine amidase [Planctomycetes bacterium]|nr:N-acetylmuramoyl-L-alanine amidase [Planctomycetota bacterium]
MQPSRALAQITLLTMLTPLTTAQVAVFFRDANPAAVLPVHRDVAAAVAHLCAGPSATEAANGYYSHLPPATQLLRVRRNGDAVQLLFDVALLKPAPGMSREDAIEQIDKTVLSTPGVRHVEIRVRRADGSEVSLAEALGETAPPAPTMLAPSAPPSAVASFGALAQKRVAVSPGHGYYWHSSLGWITQRGDIDGLIEDIHTAQIANRYLIPFLENMGAEVVFTREHGEVPSDVLVDDDGGAPAYSETGSWTTSASSGYAGGGYRYAGSNPTVETATATWQLTVPQDGLYPVYAWFRASSNRTPSASYRVHHAGGVDTVVVDQTVDNLTWAHLGTWWFRADQGAEVVLSNLSPAAGVVIADTVRLGGGLGSVSSGGGTSNQARWRECARYWALFSGAPSTVWNSISGGQDNDDDVTARPRFAEWRGADAFISLHTNAAGTPGTGAIGTSTYIYNGGATAGSSTLSQKVHTQIVDDLRAEWNAGWADRGQLSANFGEVRLLSTMPGILVELAFHDTPGSLDHTSLHDPEFRYLAARAYARGVLRYFAPTAPFPPEPPGALRVVQSGTRGLRVEWDAAAGATHYTVEQSLDGKGFVQVADVTGGTWTTPPLPHHSVRSFRVRAWNATGRSFPTEVLTAGTDHLGTAQLLLVQGFDRLDRYVKGPDNTRDYLRLFGDALRRDADFSCGFDAASNEAVKLGRVTLPTYDAVVWSLGEESSADDTFDASEQSLVTSYLNGGGAILVSGAEVGWDLDHLGSASDRNFYRNVLGATYTADDAGTYGLQAGIAGTVSAGTAATTFDNGNFGSYDVNYPDVLAPTTTASTTCLRYANGLIAGVQKLDPLTGARTVVLGLPLETIVDATARARLLQQSVLYLLGDQLALRGPTQLVMGGAAQFDLHLDGENNLPYIFALSEGYTPGTVLPLGSVLPLNHGLLLELSVTPGSPFFVDFVGQLDASGSASPLLTVPPLPFLDGLPIYFAGLSLATGVPVERKVSNWVRLTLKL